MPVQLTMVCTRNWIPKDTGNGPCELRSTVDLNPAIITDAEKNGGYIINISSVTAKQPSPHGCAYAATKAGLASFSSSLFDEARKYGVKVTAVYPDMTETNLYRNADFTVGEEKNLILPRKK